jgi:hypothetical protein
MNVKFERFVPVKSWGQTYNNSPKKRKRYEDKRQAKSSERYKKDECEE